MIEVKQTGHSDPLSFDAVIRDSGSQTRHQVTLSKADYGRLQQMLGGHPLNRRIVMSVADDGVRLSIRAERQ